MGTWNAFYVLANELTDAPSIGREFPTAEVEKTEKFVALKLPDDAFEAPEAQLCSLSARLKTDVIWLGFQSVVDAFQFHHWQHGKLLRSLVYGCFDQERTWERVAGEAEPWERTVFFDEKYLTFALKYVDSEPDRNELRRIWRDQDIKPGQTEPGGDSRSWAHEIAQYYKLPHYG